MRKPLTTRKIRSERDICALHDRLEELWDGRIGSLHDELAEMLLIGGPFVFDVAAWLAEHQKGEGK